MNRDKDEECGCVPNGPPSGGSSKTLKIKWQRLISGEETCPRCGSTEKEIEKAVSSLTRSLAPLGIDVDLERREISLEEFEKDPSQSNRIWLSGRPLEEWIGGKTGQSPCCDVCAPSKCRTVEVEGDVYEVIPANLIIGAGLAAASQLMPPDEDEPCCGET